MKRKASVIVCFLAALTVIINIAFVVKDSFFYSLDNLPTGIFIREDFNQNVLFSTGYKLKVYQVEKSRHFPSGIRVELCNDLTGETRTIYWQTNTEASIIYWYEDRDHTVSINGIPIDYSNSTYDCRDYVDRAYTINDESFSKGLQ